jgi:hypothetical protein
MRLVRVVCSFISFQEWIQPQVHLIFFLLFAQLYVSTSLRFVHETVSQNEN